MDPTLAGFKNFVANVMKVPSSALDLTDPTVGFSYSSAVDVVNPQLQCVPASDPSGPSLYAKAVYNLAGDILVNVAQDARGSQFFAQLRKDLNIVSFVGGIVTSTADQGSSTSIAVPESLQNLTIGQLQNLKTPWGRMYLQIAQSVGTNWGLS